MFNFMVIKKNTILLFLLMSMILVIIYLSIYSKTSNTFSNTYLDYDFNKGYDFDCDGASDEISSLTTNSTCSIKIKNSLGESLLKSNKFDYSLFDNSPSNPVNIYYIDVNRNKVPELVLTGIKNNLPIFYVFQWTDNTFKETLISYKNIFGILDFNNSRTPKILTSNSDKGDSDTDGFIINSSSIKNINFSKPTIPSLGIMQKLIDLIQLEYEIDDAPGIFSPDIPSSELGLLWNLDKSTYKYTFQKAYFYDYSWNDLGVPTKLHWILSFEKVNYLNSNLPPEEIVIYTEVLIDELNEYKISSLKKNK